LAQGDRGIKENGRQASGWESELKKKKDIEKRNYESEKKKTE
jgi:hypothetical protein